METTRNVYIVMWLLIVIPIFIVAFRRMFIRKINEKTRIRPAVIVAAVLGTVLCSVFLYAAYRETLVSRYELAAERYAEMHAEYLVGNLTKEAYTSEITPLRAADNKDATAFDETLFAQGTIAGPVRFQVSSWIIPKYFADDAAFPATEVIDENNPVFVIYLLDDGSSETYYILRMQKTDTGWQVTYQSQASDEQLAAAQSALPSKKNGQWFTVDKK